MATTSLLSLAQAAAAEMGLSPPAYLVGNSQADAIQLFYLMNSVGNELVREYDWAALCTEHRFNTATSGAVTANVTAGSTTISNISPALTPTPDGVDTNWMVIGAGVNADTYVSSQTSTTSVVMTQGASTSITGSTIYFCKTIYTMAADYDRPIDRTQWNKSAHWEMIGPQTQQQWEWLKSGYISTGPRQRFTMMGSTSVGPAFQIWPPSSTSIYIGLNYVSNYWAHSAAGVGQSAFAADTDSCIFPDRLMIEGLKHKYFQVKGLQPIYLADYEKQKSLAIANDKGSSILSFAPQQSEVLLGMANIPDSGYGS